MIEVKPKVWVCRVCGYIYYGENPPEECPVCGAGPEEFDLQVVEQSTTSLDQNQTRLKILIAGGGIAGISAAEAARKASPLSEILLLSRETEKPYYRINLTRYLAGEVSLDQMDLHPSSWYADHRIELKPGVSLASIDLQEKAAVLDNGEKVSFDRLILAVGARPFVPPVPGAGLDMVFTLRTKQDANDILRLGRDRNVVCIGGGLLGLETAGALARQGARVTVLEGLSWLMPRQLNIKAAEVFQAFIEKLGIKVLTGIKVKELQGSSSVTGILLDSGKVIPADLVVFSAGVRADTYLAAAAGLKVNQGIVVDENMLTSHADIYAAGDVAEYSGMLYGTWAPALAQGNIAGSNAAGQPASFLPVPRSAVLKVLGIDLFSIGRIAPEEGDTLIDEAGPDWYEGFVFQAGLLVGAILMGDTSASSAIKKAVEEKLECSAILETNPSVAVLHGYINKSVIM